MKLGADPLHRGWAHADPLCPHPLLCQPWPLMPQAKSVTGEQRGVGPHLLHPCAFPELGSKPGVAGTGTNMALSLQQVPALLSLRVLDREQNPALSPG